MSEPMKRDEWFRVWMPYCLKQFDETKVGKNVWLPLNRHYKPLGQPSGVWVDYNDFASHAIKFSRDPHEIDGVWEDKDPHPNWLYLYSDNSAHRGDYFVRLGRLMTHGKGWK
ncbi:hypothetical protein E9232_004880 [Inquilinus ginsengisoli]|uniref:Uncharacterized protein n=1 Tax=Inquilinus ginsengisoli TaxID=363840 RepID=A0ABU1JUP2_9PROT|nr:hypothetical protein [Inquilinus ginsengisoli]MDR6292340.1 hypothetical protein [Inquilinus ginsengisoli]